MASQEDIEIDKARSKVNLQLGSKVRHYREIRGLSQVDLAGKMKEQFDTNNVSRTESG